MDIGQRCYDGYTQYLQQVRTDFLRQETITFHTFGHQIRQQDSRNMRNIKSTISDTKVESVLTNTPKNTHLLLGIASLKYQKS